MENSETINSMIDKIIDGDNVSAKEDFESLIAAKLSSALDAKKQEVAQSVYAGQEEQPQEEPSEEEIEDESV